MSIRCGQYFLLGWHGMALWPSHACAPPIAWGLAKEPSEEFIEMGLVGYAAIDGNLCK